MTTLNLDVDKLGKLLAKKADLDREVSELKTAIKSDAGKKKLTELEGKIFRVKIVNSDRKSLDMKSVRNKLTTQFITAHTKVTNVTAVKCTSRKEIRV